MFQASQEENEKDTYDPEASEVFLTKDEVKLAPLYVSAAYLFSPYTLLSCAGQTTTILANFFTAASLLSMIKGKLNILPINVWVT